MKKIHFLYGWMCVFFMTPLTTSADECKECRIPVEFKGVYTDETCIININGSGTNSTITLPTISTSSLSKNGDEAGSVRFDIELKDCQMDKGVILTFTSDETDFDNITGNLKNQEGDNNSQNVQLRIRKENDEQIKINDRVSGQSYITVESGVPVKHFYSVSYYADGDSAVTAGLVSSIANVELIYR